MIHISNVTMFGRAFSLLQKNNKKKKESALKIMIFIILSNKKGQKLGFLICE